MKYSHLDEGFDFQVIFEYLLFTYSDVDIDGRHIANAFKNYGKRGAASFRRTTFVTAFTTVVK